MNLYLHRPETKTVWQVKFDSPTEIRTIIYNGRDVTKRLEGTRWEDVIYNAYDEKMDLHYESYCYEKGIY